MDESFPRDGSNAWVAGSTMEQRKNVRLPLRLSGQLVLDDGEARDAETQDVSLRGAFLERVYSGDADRSCVLTLFAGDEDVFSVTVDGRVVYEDERGCGIEFQSMDRKDFEALEAFLEVHVPDPARLQREIRQGSIPDLKDWMISGSA